MTTTPWQEVSSGITTLASLRAAATVLDLGSASRSTIAMTGTHMVLILMTKLQYMS